MALYDDDTDLAAAVRWTRQWMPGKTAYWPLAAWHMRTELPPFPAKRLALWGQCGHLAGLAAGQSVALISPPGDLPRPAAADRLFLRKYTGRPPWPLAEDDPLRIEYAYLLTNSCPPGGTVLDVFAGNGTTIIAAERLRMRALLAEASPAHCDAIRQHWAAFVHGAGCDWQKHTPGAGPGV